MAKVIGILGWTSFPLYWRARALRGAFRMSEPKNVNVCHSICELHKSSGGRSQPGGKGSGVGGKNSEWHFSSLFHITIPLQHWLHADPEREPRARLIPSVKSVPGGQLRKRSQRNLVATMRIRVKGKFDSTVSHLNHMPHLELSIPVFRSRTR